MFDSRWRCIESLEDVTTLTYVRLKSLQMMPFDIILVLQGNFGLRELALERMELVSCHVIHSVLEMEPGSYIKDFLSSIKALHSRDRISRALRIDVTSMWEYGFEEGWSACAEEFREALEGTDDDWVTFIADARSHFEFESDDWVVEDYSESGRSNGFF